MATVRYSVNPEDNDHQVTRAAGLAVVTKNIEVTVDYAGLAALTPSMSEPQRRLQVVLALEKIISFIETSDKFSLPG